MSKKKRAAYIQWRRMFIFAREGLLTGEEEVQPLVHIR